MTMRLEDREAIRDVITAYAHAIDRRRWDIMEHLFHADAQFAFGSLTGDWKSFVDQARDVIEPTLATQHQLGQILFNFSEETVCHTETYMTAMHTIPPGYPRSDVFPAKDKVYSGVIAGRYLDRFEKRTTANGVEWRMAQRTGVYDWREYREVEGGDMSDLPADFCGAHDESDPSTPAAARWMG